MMHFVRFDWFTHFCCKMLSSRFTPFPQFFWDWKVESADFFTFRMYDFRMYKFCAQTLGESRFSLIMKGKNCYSHISLESLFPHPNFFFKSRKERPEIGSGKRSECSQKGCFYWQTLFTGDRGSTMREAGTRPWIYLAKYSPAVRKHRHTGQILLYSCHKHLCSFIHAFKCFFSYASSSTLHPCEWVSHSFGLA